MEDWIVHNLQPLQLEVSNVLIQEEEKFYPRVTMSCQNDKKDLELDKQMSFLKYRMSVFYIVTFVEIMILEP